MKVIMGIQLDQKFVFVVQAQSIVDRVLKMLGFIKRSMKDFNILQAIKKYTHRIQEIYTEIFNFRLVAYL